MAKRSSDRRGHRLAPKSVVASAVSLVTAVVVGVGYFRGCLGDVSEIRDIVQEQIPGSGVDLIVTLASLANEPRDSQEMELPPGNQHTLAYRDKRQPGQLDILYDSDYLRGVAAEVGILGEGPFFTLPKVGLDMKVVNNGKQTIFLTEAVFEVRTSSPDDRPLMVFTHNAGVVNEIEFTNDGWGAPTSIKLHARFKGSNVKDYHQLPHRVLESQVYRFGILPLLESYGIPIAPIQRAIELRTEEMNLSARADELMLRAETTTQPQQKQQLEERQERLREQSSELSEQMEKLWAQVQPSCARRFQLDFIPSLTIDDPSDVDIKNAVAAMSDEELAQNPYGCFVEVEGYLEFSGESPNGSHPSRITFETVVYVTPPDGLGADGFDPTGDYDVELRTAGSNYTVRVPLSQPIEVGKPDRFILWLGAAQSSSHEFVVHLNYNDGHKLTSPRIRLSYLMPRGNRSLLQLAAAEEKRSGR